MLATLLACLLLFGAGRLASAEDEEASPKDPPAAKPTIYTSLDAALSAAREADQLVVAALDLEPGDDAPTLPDELAEAVAKHAVVLRLPGKIGDPAADALRVRYGLGGVSEYWFVLRANGALLDSMEAPLHLVEILGSLYKRAVQKNEEYERALEQLKARTAPRAFTELLDFHLDHREYERVIALCREALQGDSQFDVRVHGALAGALGATLQRDEERRVLEHMVATWPEHAERIEWRVAICETDFHPLYQGLARAGEPLGDELRRTDPVALKQLLETVRAEKDQRGEARVRFELGDHFCPNFMDKQAHYRFVAEHAAKTWFGETALRSIADTHNWLAEYPATIAAFEALLRHHPRHAGAEYAKDQIAVTKQLMAGGPKSLSLIVGQPDEKATVGKDYRITMTIGNTTDEALERVSVVLYSTGPLRFKTKPQIEIPSLPTDEERVVVFTVQATGPGTMRFIAYAKGVATFTQAGRLDVQVSPAAK